MRLGASPLSRCYTGARIDEPATGRHSRVFHLIPPSFRRFLSFPVLLFSEITVTKSCFNLDPIIHSDRRSELVHHRCNVFSGLSWSVNGIGISISDISPLFPCPLVTTDSQTLQRVLSPHEVRLDMSKNNLINLKVLTFCLRDFHLPSLSPVSAERSFSLQPTSAQIS